jgi:hypothetical protein
MATFELPTHEWVDDRAIVAPCPQSGLDVTQTISCIRRILTG